MAVVNSDTAVGRGIRTTIQALIGFTVGLALAVWTVPGVPDAIFAYVTSNLPTFLATIGVPSVVTGLVSYLWNLARTDVRNS